ncbi:MAG: hypothetical protein ABI432_05525 [Flavobacteriales bacterium]
MLPESVRVTRCPKCRSIYWLQDAKEIGTVPKPTYANVEVKVKRKWWFGTRTESRHVVKDSPLSELPELVHLDAEGMNEALAEIPQDHEPDSQAYLRTKLWWAFNERFRNGQPTIATEADEAMNHRNLSELLTLTEPEDDQARLKSAAILLALERFGDAEAITTMVEDERLAPFKEKFIDAARERKSRVFRLR